MLTFKQCRSPKYKEKLSSFGYMEDRSDSNISPATSVHSDDNGNMLIYHHGSTHWSHVDNNGKQTDGRGMDKLLNHLLLLHK
jgi:hypothetical protein